MSIVRRWLVLFILSVFVQMLSAQSFAVQSSVERPDSLQLSDLSDGQGARFAVNEGSYIPSSSFSWRNPFPPLLVTPQYSLDSWNRNFHPLDYVDKSYLLRWDTGKLYGAKSFDTMNGLGTMATASFRVNQRIGENMTFMGDATLMKFSPFYNNATFSGLLTYEFNPQMSASVFGVWQSPSFMSMLDVQAREQWGGYFSLKTENNKWGIDLGARQEYIPYMRRIDTTPIVMPYYNLQGQKLGLDFGGLLKSIIINHQMQKAYQNGAPMGPMGPMGPMHPRVATGR